MAQLHSSALRRATPTVGMSWPRVSVRRPGALSGLIDLDARLYLSFDARREWHQMFYEAWAATERKIHASCKAGLDMGAILRAYEPLLARVGGVGELHDLMNEMQAELGVSHAGVAPAEDGGDIEGTQGFLGVHTAWDETRGAWRIVHCLRGAQWDERAAPPLSRPGGAREGEFLTAINGRRLTATWSPERALAGLAGKDVLVTILPADEGGSGGGDGGGSFGKGGGGKASEGGGGGGNRRQRGRGPDGGGGGGGGGRSKRRGTGGGSGQERSVRVRAAGVALERRATYLDDVEAKRGEVARRCGGRAGYVHMGDMEESGFEDFSRDFAHAIDGRDALLYAAPTCARDEACRHLAHLLDPISPTPRTYPYVLTLLLPEQARSARQRRRCRLGSRARAPHAALPRCSRPGVRPRRMPS